VWPHLFDAEEHRGGQEGGGDDHPVACVPKCEWQKEVPEHKKAAGQARVGEREGGLEDTLTAPDLVTEVGQVVVLQRGTDKFWVSSTTTRLGGSSSRLDKDLVCQAKKTCMHKLV
jgi:hypothetical protein